MSQKCFRPDFRSFLPSACADVYLRYSPLLSLLNRHYHTHHRLLEVGGGPQGLAQFTAHPIVSVDISDWQQRPASSLSFLRGSVLDLPFQDRSFDWVISADMLEHLPDRERPAAVAELLRVSRKWMYLAFPAGDAARAAEDQYRTFYRERNGQDLSWLAEHRVNGLPDPDCVRSMIPAGWGVSVQPSLNARAWLWENRFQWRWRGHRWSTALIRSIAPVYLGTLRRLNWPPVYRTIITAQRTD